MEKEKEELVISFNANGEIDVVNKLDKHIDHMPAGYYQVVQKSMGLFSIPVIKQSKISLPDSHYLTRGVFFNVNRIKSFFEEKKKRVDKLLNKITKYNTLLAGRQGTGKTTAALSLIKELIKDGWVCFQIKNYGDVLFISSFIEEARKIKDFNVCLFFDECEFDLSHYSAQNSIFIGTTNHLEEIPSTIWQNRPGRIYEVLEPGSFEVDELTSFVVKSIKALPEGLEVDAKPICDVVVKTLKEDETLNLDRVVGFIQKEVYKVHCGLEVEPHSLT